jgi:Ca2+-binding RTX toxin-like protein
MAIIYGDSKDVVINGTDVFSTTVDFPPIVVTTITYNAQILTGTQATTAYGDIRDLDLEAKAVSNNTVVGVWTNFIDSYVFNFGNDTLSFGDKNNTLFGDMQDLTLHAAGGITSDGVLTAAWISRNTFTYGNDLISAGNGNNTVYGDARNVTFLAEKGNNLDGSTALDVDAGSLRGPAEAIDANQINFGADTISLGKGNNLVYGDVGDVSLSALGVIDHVLEGSPSFTMSNAFVENAFTFGADSITVGNGANQIYGDFGNFLMLADGGTTFGSQNGATTDTNGEFLGNTFTFGNDVIKIGDGNNVIYGDGHDLTLQIAPSQAIGGAGPFGVEDSNSFTFGNDIITAAAGASAAGSNVVYGDLHNLTLDNEGGHAVDASFKADSQIRLNTFIMGDDVITLGNGGNQIYGDMNDYNIHTAGGVNGDVLLFIRYAGVIGNDVQMGNDTITSGSGADTIYGDAHNIAWEAVGGVATVWNAQASLSVRAGLPDSIEYGSDTINAGGGNDIVAGDAWDVSAKAVGGQASQDGLSAMGWVNAATMAFGNDTINGGAGDDTLYGDAHSLSLAVKAGMVTGTGGDASAHMINTSIAMGNDTLTGGDGNDTLYGDLQSISFTAIAGKDTSGVGHVSASFVGDVGPFDVGGTVFDTGSLIAFGNDTLIGGNGNDFLIGDAYDVKGLAAFLDATGPNGEPNLNQLLWGDDTLTGGAGADKFGFDILDRGGLVGQGHDTITDFSLAEGDKLVVKVPTGVDYAALNAAAPATLVNADGGVTANDTKFTFHDGSAIILLNIDMTSGFNAANTVLAHHS